MGRSKSGRRRTNLRYSPAGTGESPGTSTHAARLSNNSQIKPFLAKLKSSDAGERCQACLAIGEMALNDAGNRKALLKAETAKLLLDHLTDDDSQTVVAAAVALRNLVLNDDSVADVCQQLFHANALATLQTRMSKWSTDVSGVNDMQKLKYGYQLAEAMASVMLGLVETSDAVLNSINRQVPALLPFLRAVLAITDATANDARVAAAQCLLSFLDDNEGAVDQVLADTDLLGLLFASHTSELYLAALLTASLQEIVFARRSSSMLYPELSRAPSHIISVLQRTLTATTADTIMSIDTKDRPQFLATVETSLEALSKAVTVDGEEGQDEMPDVDAAPSLNELQKYVFSQVHTQLLPAVVSWATPIVIPGNPSAEANGNPENSADGEVGDAAYPGQLLGIHTFALDTLHNLAWSMQSLGAAIASQFAWETQSRELWSWSVATLPRILVTGDEDVAESALSLMYAVALYHNGDVACTPAEINDLVKLYSSSLNGLFQSRIVGLIGALARSQGRIQVNRAAGTFLITTIAQLPSTDRECALEALDAIFEVYGDAAFDYDTPVFVTGRFAHHLTAALPKVRQMRNTTDKRRDPRTWQRCDEALQNLEAFIEYKRDEAR
ncbi:hypothetical protein PYCC9005_005543 [Savitreella phatthalungensis]